MSKGLCLHRYDGLTHACTMDLGAASAARSVAQSATVGRKCLAIPVIHPNSVPDIRPRWQRDGVGRGGGARTHNLVLPKHVRDHCATPRQVSCVGSACHQRSPRSGAACSAPGAVAGLRLCPRAQHAQVTQWHARRQPFYGHAPQRLAVRADTSQEPYRRQVAQCALMPSFQAAAGHCRRVLASRRGAPAPPGTSASPQGSPPGLRRPPSV